MSVSTCTYEVGVSVCVCIYEVGVPVCMHMR